MMEVRRGFGNFVGLGTCVEHVSPAITETDNDARKLCAKNADMRKVIEELICMLGIDRPLCRMRNQEIAVYVKETKREIADMVSDSRAICILKDFIPDDLWNWISLLKDRP
jgi:hypothetical protein